MNLTRLCNTRQETASKNLEKTSGAMTVICNKRILIWNKTINRKNFFCKKAKIDINGYLFLPQDFSKKQIVICSHAYEEIDQEGFYDGSIHDRQQEYRRKVKKEMKF